MPEFVKGEGESEDRMSAVPGSPLHRALERDPDWRSVDETPVEEPVETDADEEGDSLDDLNRQELNDLATELGVEGAEGLANKDAVKAVILEAKEADNG